MDEHIQIPKSILKPFSTVSHAINDDGNPIKQNITYVLDVDGNIFPQDIKDCNIKKGYYNPDCEKHLAQCETAFGDLKAKILQSINQGILFSFSDNDIGTIKQFYKTCYNRSQVLHQELIIGLDKIFPGISFGKVQNAILMENPPSLNVVEKKNNVKIFINETETNFIIPQSCWYYIGEGKNEILFMPISPQIGLALYHRKHPQNISFCHITKSEHMDIFNGLAIFYEFKLNRQYVYAIGETDLKRYLPFVEVIKK